MSKKDIELMKSLIENAEKSVEEAKNILKNLTGEEMPPAKGRSFSFNAAEDSGKVVEGRFDGQSMMDDTGKIYPVPANYASKSKLVEGDRLKLTISPDGSFLFKQIGPVERRRVIGAVKQDVSARGYILEAEGKIYKVLLASITYFKVGHGDSVVALIPKDTESSWAAIENALQGGGLSQNLSEAGLGNNSSFGEKSSSEKNEPVKNIDEIIGNTIAEMEKEEGETALEKTNEFEW